MSNLVKDCADYLRFHVSCINLDSKFKPSHAHEIVAAGLGYKSHSSLLLDKKRPFLANVDDAFYLLLDEAMIEQRRRELKELPSDLPESSKLLSIMREYFKESLAFKGFVLALNPSEISEELLPLIDLELDVIGDSEFNVGFGTMPDILSAIFHETDESLTIEARCNLTGEVIDDEKRVGNMTIDFVAQFVFQKLAGDRALDEPEIIITRLADDDDDDWYDESDQDLEELAKWDTVE